LLNSSKRQALPNSTSGSAERLFRHSSWCKTFATISLFSCAFSNTGDRLLAKALYEHFFYHLDVLLNIRLEVARVQYKLKTVGDRSFCSSGLRAWNYLPPYLRAGLIAWLRDFSSLLATSVVRSLRMRADSPRGSLLAIENPPPMNSAQSLWLSTLTVRRTFQFEFSTVCSQKGLQHHAPSAARQNY